MTRERLDLRLAPLALAGWGAAAVGQGWDADRVIAVAGVLLLCAAVCVAVDLRWRRRGGPGPLRRAVGVGRPARPPRAVDALGPVLTGVLVVAAGGVAVAGLRSAAAQVGPVGELARERAVVGVEGRLISDPVERSGQFGPFVVLRMLVEEVSGRGAAIDVRSPVLVIADPAWADTQYGSTVSARGRLDSTPEPDLAAVLVAIGPPSRVDGPSWLHRAVARVRAGITEAAAPLPETESVLVPALVNGDDAGMPDQAVEEFRVTGLTHLLAVSGANVTLVVGFVLVVARWSGVRGRGLTAVGVAAVVFFVLVARPQPSVLRAAAMGVAAIVGLAAGGRARGIRALSLAVLVLVLVDPWLARSVGFLLSVLATAGILLLAPPWREALGGWLPRPLAEAVAVPLAAQVVCTPVVAALSGQVSLVAVIANLLVAPAVGPTTVLGFVGGLLAVLSPPVGHVVGHAAGAFAWWIVSVARHGAALDGAAVGWPVGSIAIGGLVLLCAAQVAALTWLLHRRWPCLVLGILLVGYVVHPLGRPGWPPDGWRMVMCDVGQGDGLVLNAGQGAAVVVDTGPDPHTIDRCLDRLEVEVVALVVLTHFHADHVDGLKGVLDGRRVGEVEVSPHDDPTDRAAMVRALAVAAGVPVTVGTAGAVRVIGPLRLETLGPPAPAGHAATSRSSDGEGSAANNASLVLRASAGDLDLLLAADSEREEQSAIVESGADLETDVLKVAHHGSANQDPRFVLATGADLALISVGADNDYGHPAGHLLGLLDDLGASVYRTDEHGDIAVVDGAGGLTVVPWR